MSWMNLLINTYDNLLTANNENINKTLLPMAHSTQKAHVTVNLDIEGNFLGAEYVADIEGKNKNLSETLIPMTKSRTNGIIPLPLCDKLQYLAKDYLIYTGIDNEEYYKAYIEQLAKWDESEYSTDKVHAIYKYISKGCLTTDLVQVGIFSLDDNMKLTEKWNNTEIKLSTGKQEDAFIRFTVLDNTDTPKVWQDRNLQESYIKYYEHLNNKLEFCYVYGEEKIPCESHPGKIRHSGDMAKLISGNDTSGFTFRGRFENSNQAVNISYEASQKAHNALKYLIQKQGERLGEKAFVLWGTNQEKTPMLNEDTLDFMFDEDEEDLSIYEDTNEAYANRFNKAVKGYKSNIKFDSKYAIIGIDAATKGRMSIIFYREYTSNTAKDLIDRIELWHTTASWIQKYKSKDKKKIIFYGAPSPYDIALCAFGIEQGDFIGGNNEIIYSAVQRILPCIIDGVKIPRDIVSLLVNKCFSPQNYKNEYNWKKVLTVTCSMYKKYLYDYKGEKVYMKIDENCTDLDYNLGRLLSVADEIEKYANYDPSDPGGNKRVTNAMRYFNRFAHNPNDTWKVINDKLIPYINKLGDKANYLLNQKAMISIKIPWEELKNARNLDGKMALGFDSQKKAMLDDIKNMKENKKEKQEEK